MSPKTLIEKTELGLPRRRTPEAAKVETRKSSRLVIDEFRLPEDVESYQHAKDLAARQRKKLLSFEKNIQQSKDASRKVFYEAMLEYLYQRQNALDKTVWHQAHDLLELMDEVEKKGDDANSRILKEIPHQRAKLNKDIDQMELRFRKLSVEEAHRAEEQAWKNLQREYFFWRKAGKKDDPLYLELEEAAGVPRASWAQEYRDVAKEIDVSEDQIEDEMDVPRKAA